MRPSPTVLLLAASCAALLPACAAAPASRPGDLAAYEAAAARNRAPANPADVRFVSGMIPHHAQAVLFAGWAESHGASRAIRVLCERIVVAQRDEIATMRTWLADHGQPVPPGTPESADMRLHGGMHGDHAMMPGMLSAAQLEALDAARGEAFDRLFLESMIPHHQGALLMVDELFASYGGANDDFIYKLASDIYADQTTEIERMRSMLEAMPTAQSPR